MTEKERGTSRKRRTRAEKVGRLKYIIQRLRQLERKIDRVDAATKMILAGLRDFMSFESSYIQDIACENELDRQILTVLVEKGEGGLMPSEIAERLHTDRWKVSRSVKRMNRRLRKELGQDVAEKDGWRWRATNFLLESWQKTRPELG